ncbi:MAG: hypothetical protein LQ350_006334 [Teloschistes chrysophthalmus]|nr:MAG: hypothetical protein LQ350_006334 [Niorma chrysophthalma]
MLLRIYDVILTEGASETLMRVALSLMRRNDQKIKACTEFEDVMHLLLSRELWDTYNYNANELVNDFVGLTGLVTRESLEALEKDFKESQNGDQTSKISSTPSIQAAASGFLGRFWAGSSSATKVTSSTSSLGVSAPSRPSSFLRRTPSKQSVASTLNSIETIESSTSKISDATTMSRNPSADCANIKATPSPTNATSTTLSVSYQDKDLHSQIEDLLTALTDMQRQHNLLAGELQQEREEREEDRAVVCCFLARTKEQMQSAAKDRQADDKTDQVSNDMTYTRAETVSTAQLEDRFGAPNAKRSSIVQTKYELRDDLKLWKDQYEIEATRSADLLRQLADRETENTRVLEQFREVRSRLQESQREKQKLEKTIEGMKSRRPSNADSLEDLYTPVEGSESRSSTNSGLRELKLGRSGSIPTLSAPAQPFSKRSSSLGLQTVLATDDHKPLTDETLLLELVNAKTSEAIARQELEEVKGKLDSLRRMLGGPGSPVTSNRPSPIEPSVVRSYPNSAPTARQQSVAQSKPDPLKVATPASSTGGFFSGWGKRTVSNPTGNGGRPESSK